MERMSVTYQARPERGRWAVEIISMLNPPFEVAFVEPLEHIYVHCTPGGDFSWGDGGPGSTDSALSILAHHFGESVEKIQAYYNGLDPEREISLAWKYHQDFTWRFVAPLAQHKSWRITTEQVDALLAVIDDERMEIEYDRLADVSREGSIMDNGQREKRNAVYQACVLLRSIVPKESSEYRVLLNIEVYALGLGPEHSTLSGLMERWELFNSHDNTDEDKAIYKTFIVILQAAGL